jgi:hypothetical protein
MEIGYANILHGVKQGVATIIINPPSYNRLAIKEMQARGHGLHGDKAIRSKEAIR